ncbi:MAG: hypothetical protein AAFV25_01975, partial [Bacteroidota bacterium]
HYEKMIDISLKDFIENRLDKKVHSPENSVILWGKTNKKFKMYDIACGKCHMILKRSFTYKKKQLLGYDIRPRENYDGSKKKISISFSDPYRMKEDHPFAYSWKEEGSNTHRRIQITSCQGDVIKCRDYYHVFDISTGEAKYVKSNGFVSSANLD